MAILDRALAIPLQLYQMPSERFQALSVGKEPEILASAEVVEMAREELRSASSGSVSVCLSDFERLEICFSDRELRIAFVCI
jgi:predicted transcriptional regulator